jgi:hypothetical protein
MTFWMIRISVLGLIIAGLLVWAPRSHACGKERWPVKTGTDKDVEAVVIEPKSASIELLTRVIAPKHPNAQPDTRHLLEFHTFTITGRLTLIKKEADQDYHMVVKDDQGRTMIVEAPDPACAAASRFLPEITAVRESINGFFGGPIKGKVVPKNVRIIVTGVAFFDLIHGQTGVAPNGIELHPILGIGFIGNVK